MKAIDPNYVAPERETIADGKYKVNKFDWITVDSNQNPHLVPQKDGKLVGRLRFTQVDGKEGPPMSLTLGEMPLLAKAFGVPASKLSSTPGEAQAGLIPQFMRDIKNLCHEQNKELTVESKNGWANTIPGMEVPQGYYYFTLSDVSSKEKDANGEVKAQQGEYGPFFFVEFEIVAGEGGSETPYKGAKFAEIVNYAVQVDEQGQADWERSPVEKKYTKPAVLLSKLMRLTAPDLFVDEFTPPNPHNILPYWKKEALRAKRVLKSSRAPDDKGVVRLVWGSLEEVTNQPQRIIEELGTDDKVRKVLVEALDNLIGEKSTMNGTYKMSEKGKEIAQKYIKPLRTEGKIKSSGLEKLTQEEVLTILNHLMQEAGLDQSYKERVIMLGVGFEPPVEEEEDDSPF